MAKTLLTYIAPSALVVAAGAWAFWPEHSESRPDYLNHTFSDVASKKVSLKDYVMEFENMPEVIAAKKNGILRGFLCDPNDEDLQSCFRDLLKGKLDDKVMDNFAIPNFLKSYHNHASLHNPVTVPTMLGGVFGKPVQAAIVFGSNIIDSVGNNAELRSRIIHELQHVDDAYYGFSLNGKPINLGQSSSQNFTSFLDDLKELRAYHKQLEDLLVSQIQTGNSGVRDIFLGTMAKNYLHYWEEIEKCGPNERYIRDAHFECYRDITVHRVSDGLKLDYDLLGRKDSIGFGMKN